MKRSPRWKLKKTSLRYWVARLTWVIWRVRAFFHMIGRRIGVTIRVWRGKPVIYVRDQDRHMLVAALRREIRQDEIRRQRR